MSLFSCSMSPAGERESMALRQCVQARVQLEEAIAGVIKAEVQLRGNSREVRGLKQVLNPLLSLQFKPFIMLILTQASPLSLFLIVHCSVSVFFFFFFFCQKVNFAMCFGVI